MALKTIASFNPKLMMISAKKKKPEMNQALSHLFFPYAGINQIRLYEFHLRLFSEPPQKKRLLIHSKKHAGKKT
jgi:hypothetical protein